MIHVDWETYGEVELRGKNSVGLHNYFLHPKTELLMLAWAFDDEPPECWELHKESMPDKLRKGLEDSKELVAAWNSQFERYGFWYKVGMKIPIERWADPQSSARYLSLPDDLETAGIVLGLPPEMMKDAGGERLIDIFSKPQVIKKKGQPTEYRRRDWNTDPADWVKFCSYNKQDVVAEREIMRRLRDIYKVFPLPEREQRIWQMDQRINDRGIPIDRKFVEMGLKLATREKDESKKQQNSRTGLANANSRNQLLEWAKTQGYAKNTLKKGTVEAELKFNENLTPLCREVLEARKDGGSTSYKKLAAILRQVSPDGRLRNQFIYMGASRSGRWSGNAVQLQNLAKPSPAFENPKILSEARQMIINGDYDLIRERFGSVLTTVKYCLRTAFIASPGKKFDVADLSAIETRVGAWETECTSLMKVFEQGRDPYLDYASKLTQIPYEMLEHDLKSKDPAVKARAKGLRQMGKPVILGCIFQLGGGDIVMIKGDPTKSGLWGYAEGYGVMLTKEQAANYVKLFRDAYPEIPVFWYACEKAITEVLAGTRTVRELGPNGCIKVDKINIEGRDPVLRIQLPSGRYLHYVDAHMESLKMPWKDREGNDVYRESLVYSGVNQTTRQWECGVTSRGGKMCLGGDTRVITDRGVISLASIRSDDRVWDGVEFVRTDGVVNKGFQEVGEWIGIRGTAEHQILVGNSWLKLMQMGELTTHIALLSARASVPALFCHRSRVKKGEPSCDAIAERYSTLRLGRCGEGKLKRALSVLRENQSQRLSDIRLSPIKNSDNFGCTGEPASYPAAQIKRARLTKIMADAESHITKHGTTSRNGWNMLSHFRIGINWARTWIESTMKAIMNRGTFALWIGLRIRTIVGELRYWNMRINKFLTRFLEGFIHRIGALMPYAIISAGVKPRNGAWNFIGKAEVFDLMNCGPRHRFMILTNLGPVLAHNCENITQGIARDVLADDMLDCEDLGIEINAHAHDEIIAENEDSFCAPSLIDMEAIMAKPNKFLPGLLLKGEGFSSEFYRKG